jgi:hypothetical protein
MLIKAKMKQGINNMAKVFYSRCTTSKNSNLLLFLTCLFFTATILGLSPSPLIANDKVVTSRNCAEMQKRFNRATWQSGKRVEFRGFERIQIQSNSVDSYCSGGSAIMKSVSRYLVGTFECVVVHMAEVKAVLPGQPGSIEPIWDLF